MTAVALAQGEFVDCPDCDGQGVTTKPLYGRFVFADVVERACTACQTTGVVDAERVAICSVCTGVIWAEDACQHRDEPRCTNCAGRCSDCDLEARL